MQSCLHDRLHQHDHVAGVNSPHQPWWRALHPTSVHPPLPPHHSAAVIPLLCPGSAGVFGRKSGHAKDTGTAYEQCQSCYIYIYIWSLSKSSCCEMLLLQDLCIIIWRSGRRYASSIFFQDWQWGSSPFWVQLPTPILPMLGWMGDCPLCLALSLYGSNIFQLPHWKSSLTPQQFYDGDSKAPSSPCTLVACLYSPPQWSICIGQGSG